MTKNGKYPKHTYMTFEPLIDTLHNALPKGFLVLPLFGQRPVVHIVGRKVQGIPICVYST